CLRGTTPNPADTASYAGDSPVSLGDMPRGPESRAPPSPVRVGAWTQSGTSANARTGNVPKPSTAGGAAVNRAPRGGSSPRFVRGSPTGPPAPSRDEGAGRSPPDSVSSMFSESMPTSAAPASTSHRAASPARNGAPAPYSGRPNQRSQPV